MSTPKERGPFPAMITVKSRIEEERNKILTAFTISGRIMLFVEAQELTDQLAIKIVLRLIRCHYRRFISTIQLIDQQKDLGRHIYARSLLSLLHALSKASHPKDVVTLIERSPLYKEKKSLDSDRSGMIWPVLVPTILYYSSLNTSNMKNNRYCI